jgi:flagellar protein FlbD
MVKVTRLNGSELVINADLIEFVEAIPDTIISLVTGKKIMVKESPDDVIIRVAEFKRLSSGIHIPKKVEQLRGEEHA